MTINIKDPETDRLAREWAALTGLPLTRAVKRALEESLERATAGKIREKRRALSQVLEDMETLPVLDPHFGEDDLYDENGLPR